MNRLSDQVCDMVADALTRMAFGEQVDGIEFSLTLLPTPGGLAPAGLVHVAIKGPVIGSVLRNISVLVDLSALTQQVIDETVHQSLEVLRSQRASILTAANGFNQ